MCHSRYLSALTLLLLVAATGCSGGRRVPLQVAQPNSGDLQLVGDTPFTQLLQIFHDGTWGNVCNANFTQADALVACAQALYSDTQHVQALVTQPLTQNSTVWVWNPSCVGNESTLAACPGVRWAAAKPAACRDHAHNVGLACTVVTPKPKPPCHPTESCTGTYSGNTSNMCDASQKTFIFCRNGRFVRRVECGPGKTFNATTRGCTVPGAAGR